HLAGTKTEPIVIRQPIGFIVADDDDALEKKDELSEWLYTEEPVVLEFSDEKGRHYYAVIQNTLSDFERFLKQRKGTLEFLCVDPYSYGPQETHTFTESTTIINKGTANALPIIELRPSADTTF